MRVGNTMTRWVLALRRTLTLGALVPNIHQYQQGCRMTTPKYEKPPVQYGSSGVSRVEPADILRSKVGREEIRKAADAATALKLRQANGKQISQA
jgi:hypothetical protein